MSYKNKRHCSEKSENKKRTSHPMLLNLVRKQKTSSLEEQKRNPTTDSKSTKIQCEKNVQCKGNCFVNSLFAIHFLRI